MNTSPPLRIALVEDHALMREGLRALLGVVEDMMVVDETSTVGGVAALQGSPDVIVCDLVLPDGRGSAVVREIGARFPSAAILVVSMIDNPADVRMCFAEGARGYLPKGADSTDLIGAIRQVASGKEWVHPRLGAAVGSRSSPATVSAAGPLTDPGSAVLRHIAEGHTNVEIAAILGLSLRTVEKHRSLLYRTLGVRTKSELLREAAERGLLDPG